jgi:hypothetical protein
MIRTFLERRRVKRVFEKLVDPETVETVLRGGVPPITQGRIEFVLAFVRAESPTQISERVGRVADLTVEHGAVVFHSVGALVVAAFGTLRQPPSSSGSRASLVQALREQLAGDVKIVHGAADGHYGPFGSAKRISYTFVVPKFDAILGTLSRLEFGQSEEFGAVI